MKKYLYDNKVYSLAELQRENINLADTVELDVIIPTFNKDTHKLYKKTAIIDKDSNTYTFGLKEIVHYVVFDKNKRFIEATKFTTCGRYEDDVIVVKNSNIYITDVLTKLNCSLGENNKLVLNNKFLKDITFYRYQQLEKIFTKKWLGIQAIVIDKEWMTDQQAIQAQIDSYSKLAEGAREILKSDPKNETALAIVAKADEAKMLTFGANKLMQTAKSILADKITKDDPKIDEKLSFVKNFKMTKEDISNTDKSAEMATHLISYLNS